MAHASLTDKTSTGHPSHATPQGTAHFASNQIEAGLPETAYRRLGRTQWEVSVLGFGCYRIENENKEHRKALEDAIAAGCNLIDTSTNYADGGSETCVGEVTQQLIAAGTVRREELVLVSKVGYVQGANLDLAEARETKGQPFPDMVKYMDGCWHCISPEFISEQLTLSLQRLNVPRIDAYLLHNPEYFLSDAAKKAGAAKLSQTREAFYARIEKAFTQLEEEVAKGRIQCYGVSSNTFGGEPDAADSTSLMRMWEIAGKVAAKRGKDPHEHHFSVVQLPLNLFESGPVLTANNGKCSVLEFAQQKEMGVLVNRPLNAMVGQQLLRLADFPDGECPDKVANVSREVHAMEEQFRKEIAPTITTEEGSIPAADLFRWGQELGNPEVESLPMEHWSQIENQMVRPQVKYLVEQLDTHLTGTTLRAWTGWRAKYLPALERLLNCIRSRAAEKSRKTSSAIAQKLDPFLPSDLRTATLSEKALAVLVNTPGVSCVLNGMRRSEYVKNSMTVLELDTFPVEPRFYEAFRLG